MADIWVTQLSGHDGYEFQVSIKDRRGETQHRVTLKEADYQRLTGGEASPKELVTASFHFLLEREPKESILRSFDLSVIGRYFPEYERVIRGRL
jgi:hypothetical protein